MQAKRPIKGIKSHFQTCLWKGHPYYPDVWTPRLDLWPVSKLLSTVCEAPRKLMLSAFLQQEQLGVVHLMCSEMKKIWKILQLSDPLKGLLRQLPRQRHPPKLAASQGCNDPKVMREKKPFPPIWAAALRCDTQGFFSGFHVKLLSLILCHSEACHISLKQTEEHFCLEWLSDPVSRAAHIRPCADAVIYLRIELPDKISCKLGWLMVQGGSAVSS